MYLVKFYVCNALGNEPSTSETIRSQNGSKENIDSSGKRGRSRTSTTNTQLAEGATASIEKMTDRFKRKVRHTLNTMDQHSSGGMPVVQRARTNSRKGKGVQALQDINAKEIT